MGLLLRKTKAFCFQTVHIVYFFYFYHHLECDSFHYGDNCANECNCGVGATDCDHVTGCICQNGWSGNTCDIDRDECATMQSSCNGVNKMCVNNPGSYQCMCINGYQRNSNSSICEGKHRISKVHVNITIIMV